MLRRLPGLKSRARKLLFTPDGRRIACACADHVIRLLDPEQPAAPPIPLEGHSASIHAMAVSADGRLLASGDNSGVVILWDLDPPRRRGFLFDPDASSVDGITYNVFDQVTGRTLTYTLPCGSPVPANAVCICNCVPGTYRAPPPPAAMPVPSERSGGGRYCSCNKVCTCVPVRVPSDRNAKMDFAAVDASGMLERLARLPIQQWRYRDEIPGTRHIGPMAQDFAALFGVGDDERSIHSVDAHGVTMAAIQGLCSMLAEAREEVAALGERVESLEAELARRSANERETT